MEIYLRWLSGTWKSTLQKKKIKILSKREKKIELELFELSLTIFQRDK